MNFFKVKTPKHFFLMALYGGVVIWTGWFLWRDSALQQNSGGVDAPDQQAAVLGNPSVQKEGPPPRFGVVTDVIDALTIAVNDSHRVRYLGVTVPATLDRVECLGKEALQANESMMGKTVRLEEDAVLSQAKDGAWIRYVWVPEDDEASAAYKKALNGETVLGLTEPLIVVSPEVNSPEPSVTEAVEGNNIPGADIDNEADRVTGSSAGINGIGALGEDDGLGGEDATREEPEAKIKEYMVSERIIEMGLGFPLLAKELTYYERLASAARYSSATKRGLWGKCEISQDDNGFLKVQTDESCNIKGVVISNGDKIYRTSSCAGYKDTVVLLYKGGKWLCSEEEAVSSGYVKAVDCK